MNCEPFCLQNWIHLVKRAEGQRSQQKGGREEGKTKWWKEEKTEGNFEQKEHWAPARCQDLGWEVHVRFLMKSLNNVMMQGEAGGPRLISLPKST